MELQEEEKRSWRKPPPHEIPPLSISNNQQKARMEVVFKYLLTGCQNIELKTSLISSSLFEVCNSCDQLASSILDLHLQLEVLQMKLIDKIKTLTTTLVSSSPRVNQDDSKSHLLSQFQAFVSESEKRQVEIPLLYLEKFTGSGHHPQSIITIKKERILEKVGNDLDNYIDTTNSQVHLNQDIVKQEEKEDPPDRLSSINSTYNSNLEDEGTDADVHSISEESDQTLRTPTPSLKVLQIHPRSHPDHEQKGRFGCSICSKQFQSKWQRMLHELRHDTTKDFSCDNCDFVTTTKVNLQTHSRRMHLTTGFSCEICGFATMAKVNLTEHMKRHEKPYECSECHKKFGARSDLKEHMYSHGEERNFQCHLCGSSFKQKSGLRKHNRKVHFDRRAVTRMGAGVERRMKTKSSSRNPKIQSRNKKKRFDADK